MTTRLTFLLAALSLCMGCAGSTPVAKKSGKPTVFVVGLPLQYFAERIGGDAVEVHFPLPKDQDPEFWKPDAGTVEGYQKADLILLNGAGYAKWTANASLPLATSVDTSAAFKTKYIAIEGAVTHSHGPAGEHTHSGTASHTWLDFTQAVQQANAIKDALTKLRPEQKSDFESRFKSLEKDLMNLDREMLSLVGNNASKPLLASHPVYQYWERRYGLNLKSVHWEPTDVPDDKAIAELKKVLEGHAAKWMVWEDEPKPETIAKLKELGIRCAVFNPCETAPETGDFLTQMGKNIENMKPVFANMP